MADRADLLFELGTEELPPTALKRLSESLTQSFVEGLNRANLEHGEVRSFATPRRLAVLVEQCQLQQPDQQLERRGPALQAAFDADGNPSKAAAGFARSCGVEVDQLDRLETDKGTWLVFRSEQKGAQARDLLPEIALNALNRLPIPKRMRWGASEAQFVRPVHWLLFLHGAEIVPCTLLDAEAANTTRGHRFHSSGEITIKAPAEYAKALRSQGRVIASFEERRQQVLSQVEQSAQSLGGKAEIDPDLLDEVTALVEWPVAIAGSFEEHFLEVPHEALVLTMKKNQKYFHLLDAEGRLMNHFITLSNIDSPRPELIKEGNERVVRPRLTDARFFWQQDGKRRLEDHQESLKSVVFQQKLGSMYDKSQRVAALAVFIASEIGTDVALATRAARLSRCDLMTEMVYEFPEMQGIMGRYQATRDGEPQELAQAMEEFYMPRYSGDQLPQSRTGITIALAERIDTLVGIFGIGEKPTGDKDPFALRRAALGAIRILREHSLSVDLVQLLTKAAGLLQTGVREEQLVEEVKAFILERLRGVYADLGYSHGQIEAVMRVSPHSLPDFDKRIQAVAEFARLPESESLAAANKRISNILKKSEIDCQSVQVDSQLFQQSEESALHSALNERAREIAPMLERGEYQEVLSELARLREPVDGFFDQVMVMAEDTATRNNRLALLHALQKLFLQVADISALQG